MTQARHTPGLTSKEARRLKVGDRVVFSDGVEGSVVETGYNAIKIAWEDGQIGIIHHNDMQDVSRAAIAKARGE